MSQRSQFYTPELAAKICELLAEGRSLRSICEADDMPSEATVRRWAVVDHEGFAAQYAQAREAQAHRYADELVEIADDSGLDVTFGPDGLDVNSDVIQRAKLRIDTRKWVLSKLLPKQYGDKQTVAHEGDVAVTHYVAEVPPVMDPEEWRKRFGK